MLIAHERDGFRRGTRLRFTMDGELSEDTARFAVELAPAERWNLCVDITFIDGHTEHELRAGHGGFGSLHPQMPGTLDEWLDDSPVLTTDDPAFSRTYHQSLCDLAALRFRSPATRDLTLPAAGLPWFMAVFGRDSVIASYMALPFRPMLAAATLEALAYLQATEDDPFRDAEPGKIVHEVRRGEASELGVMPHLAYYGSHDVTPLFLVLLDEYERWTGDVDLVRRMEPAARRAPAWIEGPADRDRDGFLEYRTRSDRGLVNQGWKDSPNSVLFSDGSAAEPPIALCEIQGYAYDARRRMARLARTVWLDEPFAERLEADAQRLRTRFCDVFWCEERDHPALALDGRGRRVDSLTSNIGHLLWSGILDDDRAARVAELLRDPCLRTGWGIRSMSTVDAGYHPLEYHNGTVWPHDTALVAEGLRRYGFVDQAAALSVELLDAAREFDHRLPEVFGGFARDETTIPVHYPGAARPQAWSAAAPLSALRTLLGMDVVDGELHSEPCLPAPLGRIGLRSVQACGRRVNVGASSSERSPLRGS